MTVPDDAPFLAYEDPAYWSSRATFEGVATIGWSRDLNAYYYSVKLGRLYPFLSNVRKNGRVLEIGCGVGRMGQLIAKARPDVQLVGLDFSSEMLNQAASTGHYASLVLADGARLPFASRAFDLVLAMDVLFHVVRPGRKGDVWQELARTACCDQAIMAYASGHEISAVVTIDRIFGVTPGLRLLRGRLRDRIVIWLASRCDHPAD